jgi:AmmeMemoRadiSam system protein A
MPHSNSAAHGTPLTEEEKATLLRLARQSIEARLVGRPAPTPVSEQGTIALTSRLLGYSGAFVTLNTRHSELRGCVGLPMPAQPLYSAVIEAAASAALDDPRFEPVSLAELPSLRLEISVLTPPLPVSELGVPEGSTPRQIAAAVQPGKHGLLISQGHRRGLLLPQVAIEYGWSAARFLDETCRKAGLPPNAWQHGARIEVFTAEIIHEQ